MTYLSQFYHQFKNAEPSAIASDVEQRLKSLAAQHLGLVFVLNRVV